VLSSATFRFAGIDVVFKLAETRQLSVDLRFAFDAETCVRVSLFSLLLLSVLDQTRSPTILP
jgi:hypothetical protein